MSRFSSLFTPIRLSLLERDDDRVPFDPFRPLDEVRKKRRPVSLPLAAPVGPPNLPRTRNRPGDVGRVERALGDAGVLGGERRNPVFDTRLETGVRDFQRRKGLKVDGLLNPGGPTIKALGRVLARPPLKGLSGAAVSANARLVRHLMTTTADGIVPDLMAADFGIGEAGRAKTADFLSQLFGRDPARARSLRAKARGLMATDEKSLLDKLILQARLADEDDGDEQPPEEEPPQEPEDPPYDPGHPQPGDPDDPGEDDPEEPGDPDEPEKPKPPKPDCSEEEEAVESAQEEFENAETHLEAAQGAVAETELQISETEDKIAKTEELIQTKRDNIVSIERELKKPEFIARHSPRQDHRVMEQITISARILEIEDLKEEIEQARERLMALRAELESLKETLAERKQAVEDAKERFEQARAALREAEEALTDCENRDG